MAGILTINDVISRELGERVSERSYTIRCPRRGHRDSTPSCRVYPKSEEGDGLEGSLYCWGCGFAANPVVLVKEVRGFENYRLVFEYIKGVYGVEFRGRGYEGHSNDLAAFVNFLKYYGGYVESHADEVARALALSRNGVSGELWGMVEVLLRDGI